MVVEKKGRSLTLLITGAVFSAVVIASVFAQSNNGGAPTRTHYLPEYTAAGDLIPTVKDSERYADTAGSGLLHLRSLQAEGSDGFAAAKIRMRVLPNGKREERRRLDSILSAAGQMKSSTNATGSPLEETVS